MSSRKMLAILQPPSPDALLGTVLGRSERLTISVCIHLFKPRFSSALELTRRHRIFGVTTDNARSVRRRVRYQYVGLCSGQPDDRADEASQDEGHCLWELARHDVSATDPMDWRYHKCRFRCLKTLCLIEHTPAHETNYEFLIV